MFSSLRARDFRWLWFGSLASAFAMNMQIVARGWLVYDLTSSPLDLGWVTLSFTLPQILFSLWGGVIADRLPKRTLILTGQSLNFVATSILAVIVFTDKVTFWDFIWFGAFNGTVLALSMPARQAFVPELVGDRRVFNAMALNTTSWNLARVLGPTLAGGLIAVVAAGNTSSTYGVGIVFFMIAALYFIAATTSLMVRKPGDVHEDKAIQGPLADIAEGFRYVLAHPPVFGLIMLSIVPFVFGMPINTLLPAFTEDVLGGGPDDLGVMLGTMGVGAIVGSLMLARLGDLKHKGTWLIGTCVAWGLLMAAFANTQWLSVAAMLIAMVGWASAWNMALNRGLLQMIVSPEMRGRILSIDMMSHGLMPLGILPIAYVAETVSIPAALMMAGAIFVVTMLLMPLLPSVRAINSAQSVGH
jgi:MFS family permease